MGVFQLFYGLHERVWRWVHPALSPLQTLLLQECLTEDIIFGRKFSQNRARGWWHGKSCTYIGLGRSKVSLAKQLLRHNTHASKTWPLKGGCNLQIPQNVNVRNIEIGQHFNGKGSQSDRNALKSPHPRL
jgi:hypothetical protein